MNNFATHKDLVNWMVSKKHLKSPDIIDAFLATDRKFFVDDDAAGLAYEDYPLPIRLSQTISQPTTSAMMLELLMIERGDNVLEIGSGSGWLTSVMGHLVGEDGKVVSYETREGVFDFAKENILRAALNHLPITFVNEDAYGVNEGTYDKIISGATVSQIPENWKQVLKIGGRMVIPKNDYLIVADKLTPDKFKIKKFLGFNLLPLIIGERYL